MGSADSAFTRLRIEIPIERPRVPYAVKLPLPLFLATGLRRPPVPGAAALRRGAPSVTWHPIPYEAPGGQVGGRGGATECQRQSNSTCSVSAEN